MTQFVSRFLKDESGATAIEYGLIASLVAVAIAAGVTTVGQKTSTAFGKTSTAIK